MKYLVVCFIILLTVNSFAQKNKALADSLAKLVVTDQLAAGIPQGGPNRDLGSDEWRRFKDSVFSMNKKICEDIFNRAGYPGNELVGIDGAHHFWLLVQHLDKWPDFQQRVLQAMETEVKNHHADSKDFAYLTDRVRLNTGRLQVYGTQVTYNVDSCQAIPKPLEMPSQVNERRQQIGLGPIEQYLNAMSESHFLMNKPVYEKKGIRQPKLYPVEK